MKTHASLVILLLSLVCSWGDGLVEFRNGGVIFPTPADRCVYLDIVGGQKLVGTEYVAGLWYIPGSDLSAMTLQTGQRTGGDFHFRAATTAESNKGT